MTSLLEVLQVVATTATFFVLCIYTYLTVRLAKAAERQNEITLMPIVYLYLESEQVDLASSPRIKRWLLRNIGSGPAFNISMTKLKVGERELEAKPLEILPARGEEMLQVVVVEPDGRLDFSEINVSLAQAGFDTLKWSGRTVDFVIEYSDIRGRKHFSRHELIFDQSSRRLRAKFKSVSTMEMVLQKSELDA